MTPPPVRPLNGCFSGIVLSSRFLVVAGTTEALEILRVVISPITVDVVNCLARGSPAGLADGVTVADRFSGVLPVGARIKRR